MAPKPSNILANTLYSPLWLTTIVCVCRNPDSESFANAARIRQVICQVYVSCLQIGDDSRAAKRAFATSRLLYILYTPFVVYKWHTPKCVQHKPASPPTAGHLAGMAWCMNLCKQLLKVMCLLVRNRLTKELANICIHIHIYRCNLVRIETSSDEGQRSKKHVK